MSPNCYVIVGGSSNALQDFLETRDSETTVVRYLRRHSDLSKANYVDVFSKAELIDAIASLARVNDVGARIGLILAAARTQEQLLVHESDESIQSQLESNINVHLDVVRTLLPVMIENRFGRIVGLSSFRSHVPTRGTTVYGASKAFLEQFLMGVAAEYGRFNISATAIRMGYFEGGLLAGLDNRSLSLIRKRSSLGRLGKRNDLTSALEFVMENEYASGGIVELVGALDFG